jgi:hypothetical protein
MVTWARFYIIHGYIGNIRRPRSFNEKIQYLKFYTNDARLSRYADKSAVRDYVKEVLGAEALIPLRAVVEDASHIMPHHLAGDVIVKTTHDSGSYLVVRTEDPRPISEVRTRFARLQSRRFGELSSEYWYSDIRPRILIEELLLTDGGELPSDYKLHVFSRGKTPRTIIQVDFDRHTRHERSFYDEMGNLIELEVFYPLRRCSFPEPLFLRELIDCAGRLAAPFAYCRVDLYVCKGRIFFGELTFAHGSGMERFVPTQVDFQWGGYWHL